MAGRVKADCGANLIEHSYALNATRFTLVANEWHFGSHGNLAKNACCVFQRRQSRSAHNDRFFHLHDMEFMLARDAFMAFMFIFDTIFQFRAHWRQ